MLSYVMIGVNEISRSERFYTAVLVPLGYERRVDPNKVVYALPDLPDRWNGPGAVYLIKPWDGKDATVGNGSMNAFRVESHARVHELHAAGLDAGGTDEGAPGFREAYGDRFYVAYLRDPLGNKLAVFCTNPAEPRRGEVRNP